MGPIYRYFRDIYLGVWTTLLGMKVTGRHIFMPTITVQYPHQKLTYPPRARTMLVNDVDACNGCLQCSRACPVEIIHIQAVKALPDEDLGTLPDGKKRRLHVVRFDVEMSKCVFCGLCVEACPTGAIHWESMHEEVVYTREQTMRRWSKYPAEERERLLERDAAMKAAKAEAAAKAAAEKTKAVKAAPKEAAAEPKSAEAQKTTQKGEPEKSDNAEGTGNPEKEGGKESS